MAGRLHLRRRQADLSEPAYPTVAYDDRAGGSSVAHTPEAVTSEPAMVDNRGARSGVIRERRPVDYAPDQVGGGDGGLAAGLGFVGLLAILIGAWGGIVPYIGPTFGYHSNATGSWYWDWQNSLLHLIPGAVTVLMGLWLWGMAARTRRGSGRFGSGLAALVLMATGAWFVLGPVVWPIFYSTPVFGPASPIHNFLNQLGYNLGPGVIIAALGGMTLAHAAIRRRSRL